MLYTIIIKNDNIIAALIKGFDMANKQISQLTAKPTPVASTDQFGIDDVSSDSWKITVANLQTYFTTLYLTLTGGTMTGTLLLNTSSPSQALEAASKAYVDSVATGLNIQPACRVATTAALTATYANGTAGVGATLTNSGAQAALAIDSVTLAIGDRILVKDQAAPAQNGIYTATNLGSGASNWVITRATDYDTAAEIQPGDYVLVLVGTVNTATSYVETATVVTVGTDSIVWNQFSQDVNTLITNIQNDSYNYILDTGAADVYVATLAPAVPAYVAGQRLSLKIANANTGACTVNINGLGVKSIKTMNGGDPLAGDLIAGQIADLRYDGTNYLLLNRNEPKRIQNESFNYLLETGAADAYVATIVPAVTAYVAGQRFSLKIATANTGASTLNINGLGAQAIKRIDGSALVATDLIAGMVADFRYDGTNFQLLNPARGILGTATNNNAPAGYVGEVISSTVLDASAVNIPNAAATEVTSISLTAGDWDVFGNICATFTVGGSQAFTYVGIGVITFPDNSQITGYAPTAGTTIALQGISTLTNRVSLSVTTTIYLAAFLAFSAGTAKASGNIIARRAR